MIKKNKIWVAVIIMAAALIVQSCKKGCTDPAAINYVHGATHDDATCLYCDSSVQTGESNETEVQDMNSSSSHFTQSVLLVTVNASQVVYNGNACQMLGIGTQNTNGCSTITYSAILVNQTSSTLVVSGNLIVQLNGAANITYPISSVSIQAFGSTTIGIGQVPCSTLNFFNVNFQSGSFQYH